MQSFFIKIFSTISRHTTEVREGGTRVLFRKFNSISLKILSLPVKICLFLPVIFLMRIVRPVLFIRIGDLDIGRIGGMEKALHYSCIRNTGLFEKKYFDIFFLIPTPVISNQQWLNMWKRNLRICPLYFSKFMIILYELNRLIPGGSSHVIEVMPKGYFEQNRVVEAELLSPKPILCFTKEEEEIGIKALQEFGVNSKVPFICFHNRDSSYLDKKMPGHEWSYHDYRDSTIKNYMMAAKEITKRGYYAFRMGEIVKESLIGNNSAIVDYPTNGKRSEFLDVYLGAKCDFMICSETGLNHIPIVFRRPVVLVNYVLLWGLIRWPSGIVISKKYYSSKDKRYLSFKEIIELGVFSTGDFLLQEGIRLVENTASEIHDAAIEMDERLKGNWKITKEDEDLQDRFWEILGKNKLKNPDLRVGSKFLHQNQDLLV